MVVIGRIKRGAYFDSVTLMTVGKEISGMGGVIDAAVVMGTEENKSILAAAGLLAPEFEEAGDTDLLIGIKAEGQKAAEEALTVMDEQLEQVRTKLATEDEFHPLSIEGALSIIPDANLALVSVPGRYAADQAMKALRSGLHVMLFSDNVPLEKEIELKSFAKEKSLLVMGPDCGTAIINGSPFGFANVVSRGEIGIVAASGTGLQEVSSIISNEGAGISQAIGTGGRDVKKDVGGIMFIEALKALAEDGDTKVIVLVSKPPDKEVLRSIWEVVEGVEKSVVSVFLGAEPKVSGMPSTLEEAALRAVALAKGEDPEEAIKLLQSREPEIKKLAKQEAGKRAADQRWVRGLMSGGTFAAEAQVLLGEMTSDVYSNVPVGRASKLEDPLRSQMNTVVDLGDDQFTVGRPHPMIDYSLRKKRIREEARDPQTAVILLDIVLGYGANPDPAAELSQVIRQASKYVTVVCSITGTDQDPQNRRLVEKALKDADVVVMPTNAAASRLAGYIVKYLGGK